MPLLADQSNNALRRQTPFLCHLRFRNDLPEVPCDPKMLFPPVQADRLAAYSLTSLEAELRHDLPVLPDLGIPVSLLDAAARYAAPDKPGTLHPEDAALVAGADEARGAAAGAGPRRPGAGKRLDGDLSWLMRTSYISNDFHSPSARRAAAFAAVGARKQEELDVLQELDDREGQVAAIEATFESARRPPVHPKNPELKPVEILPLLPAYGCGGYHFVDAHFEDDPTVDVPCLAKLNQEQRQWAADHSMLTYKLRNRNNEVVDYIAQLMPKDVNPASDRSPRAYDSFDYAREYAFEVRQAERGKVYLLAFQEDLSAEDALGGEPGAGGAAGPVGYAGPSVGYLELSRRLELRKPGHKGKRMLEEETEMPVEWHIYKRRMTSKDIKAQVDRMRNELGWDEEVIDEVISRMPRASPEEEAAELADELDADEDEGAGAGRRGGQDFEDDGAGAGGRRFAMAAAALEDDDEEEDDL